MLRWLRERPQSTQRGFPFQDFNNKLIIQRLVDIFWARRSLFGCPMQLDIFQVDAFSSETFGGNPAAVYFDLSYTGPAGASLTEVDVEGAGMTMIHDYAETAGKMQMVMTDAVPLSADAPVTFAPGGLHVMAMEPSDTLIAGSTAKVTLTLSDGTTATVDAPVRAAGEER